MWASFYLLIPVLNNCHVSCGHFQYFLRATLRQWLTIKLKFSLLIFYLSWFLFAYQHANELSNWVSVFLYAMQADRGCGRVLYIASLMSNSYCGLTMGNTLQSQ